MKTTARDEYIKRTKHAWKGTDDEIPGHPEIIPDGYSVSVSMLAMDSVHHAAVDSRPSCWDGRLSPGDQAAMDAMKKDADRVEAFRDHFDSKRKTLTDSPRDNYIRRLNTAWQTGEGV